MFLLMEVCFVHLVLKDFDQETVQLRPEEMIMKDEGDYYRMLKETFFEAYYDQIEEFTFKSVIVPMTLEETEALMTAYTKFMDGSDKEANLSTVDA